MRIPVGDQAALAVEDLVALGDRVDDLEVRATGPDTVRFGLGDDTWSATVVAVDSAGARDARALVADAAGGDTVVVGNKLSREARDRLAAKGIGWFDRRVGAHLVHGARIFDVRLVTEHSTDSATPAPSFRTDGPIRGRAGVSYAAALLLSPDDPPTMRAVAREAGMSPQAISNAAKLLADQGLVVDGRAAVPDLFWALADVWRPVQTATVATAPDPDSKRLTVNADDLDAPGWALGGDGAALALGAPVFATGDRPFLWVPSPAELRRAQRLLGPADPSTRAATIAIPPTPLVGTRRVAGDPWPLVHPLFAALDLARDPGRGREILDQWHPEGVARVWG